MRNNVTLRIRDLTQGWRAARPGGDARRELHFRPDLHRRRPKTARRTRRAAPRSPMRFARASSLPRRPSITLGPIFRIDEGYVQPPQPIAAGRHDADGGRAERRADRGRRADLSGAGHRFLAARRIESGAARHSRAPPCSTMRAGLASDAVQRPVRTRQHQHLRAAPAACGPRRSTSGTRLSSTSNASSRLSRKRFSVADAEIVHRQDEPRLHDLQRLHHRASGSWSWSRRPAPSPRRAGR